MAQVLVERPAKPATKAASLQILSNISLFVQWCHCPPATPYLKRIGSKAGMKTSFCSKVLDLSDAVVPKPAFLVFELRCGAYLVLLD